MILAVDRPGGSFHQIASRLVTAFKHEFNFATGIDSEIRNEAADILICFRWDRLPRILANNRIRRAVLCLYDFVTWTQCSSDLFRFRQAYQKADLIAAGNQELVEWMRDRDLNNVPTFITEDGVDTKIFTMRPLPQQFTVGWCGNSKHGHGSIKGLDIIEKACEIAKVPLVISDTGSKVVLPHDEMPTWYSRITAYVCASNHEGTPNPPLEAMACGRPVITTRCGIMPRVISHGINGFFCERTQEDIAHHIRWMTELDISRLGAMARHAAEAHDWSLKLPAWRNLLVSAAGAL